MTETIEFLLISIFFGFGLYTFLSLIFKPLLNKTKRSILQNFDNSACLLIAGLGSIYLLGGALSLLVQYLSLKREVVGFTMKDQLFGVHWYWFWIQPAIYASSQLLWFQIIRNNTWIKFLIALLLMTSVPSLIVSIISLHRDYLPSTWSMHFSFRIFDWLLCLGMFVIVSLVFHLVRRRIKIVK